MSFWKKALQYFGLSDEEEDEHEDVGEDTNSLIESAFQTNSNVRKIQRADRRKDEQRRDKESEREVARLRPVAKPSTRVHVIEPSVYNDIQQVGDKLKTDVPVVLNLQHTTSDVSKRIIDFVSGLIYGLDGNIQKVGDRTFLITPENVVVSEAERRRLRDQGLIKPF